jgi:hypothetical protein
MRSTVFPNTSFYRALGNLCRVTGQSMAEPGQIQHLLNTKAYLLSTTPRELLEGLKKNSELLMHDPILWHLK